MTTAAPASVREITGVEDAWANITNALTSNNQYATCNAGGGSSSRKLVFYGFSGIGGGSMSAVNIEIAHDDADTSPSVTVARVANGETADETACNDALAGGEAGSVNPLPATEAVRTIAITLTLASADGIVVRVTTENNGSLFSIDSLSISYTEASAGRANTPTPGALDTSMTAKTSEYIISGFGIRSQVGGDVGIVMRPEDEERSP